MSENATPKWMTVTGWVLTALPGLGLLMSASMKLLQKPEMMKMMTDKYGWPAELAPTLGIIEALVAVVYLVPRTAVLGAVLVTGYLGGAVATHTRIHDNFVAPLLLGVFAWAGLYGRDARVRALLPFRR